MGRFYVNKFPIILNAQTKETIPIGTIFTIEGIQGDFFMLRPIKKVKSLKFDLMYGPIMIDIAFNEQEEIDI